MSNWWVSSLVCAAVLTARPALATPSFGPPITLQAAPTSHASPGFCSFRHPACVFPAPGSEASALAAVATLDRVWDTATNVLRLPAPRRYEIELRAEASQSFVRERDPLSHFDRAIASSTVDGRLTPGCTLDFEVAREFFAASALGVTPAIDDASLRGEATYLAELVTPCASAPDVDVVQSRPERAAAGSPIFFRWIDEAFAVSPGRVMQALWALAPTRTPSDAAYWSGDPDGAAVMRASFKDLLGPVTTFDDVLETFAVDRALRWAPVTLEWDVAWPQEPRALASTHGVTPTGAAYVRVATKGRKPSSRLRVDLLWEEHAKMRWVAVKLDATGRELARLPIKGPERGTDAHLQIVDADGTDAILIAGTNVGDWAAPWDPNDEVLEPHGWVLTIAAE